MLSVIIMTEMNQWKHAMGIRQVSAELGTPVPLVCKEAELPPLPAFP